MISPTHCLVNVENAKNQDQVCSPVRAQWTILLDCLHSCQKKNPYETFNLGGLFCDSCQSIVIAVFEKAGWYKMDTIKRHVISKRHKKATASYTVKITGPDFFIKTERNAKSS